MCLIDLIRGEETEDAEAGALWLAECLHMLRESVTKR
jgi:hypothetical protein